MVTDQSNGDDSSAEIPSSLICPGLYQVDKTYDTLQI